MDELKCMMEIIDRNSNVISDGDYLKLCNNIKQLYKVKEGRSTFFNYDETIVSNVSIPIFGPPDPPQTQWQTQSQTQWQTQSQTQ